MTTRRAGTSRRAPAFERKDQGECLRAVKQIYQDEGRVAQTVRQYFYRLLAAGAITLLGQPNSKLYAYKFVVRLLSTARRSGALPRAAVIDTERGGMGLWVPSFNLRSSLDYASSGFVADVWRGQPRKLDVWTEHKGLAASLYHVTQDYRIRVNVTKGYISQSVVDRAVQQYGRGKGWTLPYVGDHDASGLDIERAFEAMLAEQGCYPEIVRVAITEDQIPGLDATAAELVSSGPHGDARGAAFIDKYGTYGYQAEAMRTSVLHAKLRQVIKTYVDMDKLTAALAIEQATRAHVTNTIQKAVQGLNRKIMEHGVPGLHYPLGLQQYYLGFAGEYPEPEAEDSDTEDDEDEDAEDEDEEPEDGDDGEGDDDEDLDDPEEAAWAAYQQAEADPTVDETEVERLSDVWSALYEAKRAHTAGDGDDDSDDAAGDAEE